MAQDQLDSRKRRRRGGASVEGLPMSDVRIPDGKISRRRVVQGAMWTAPAVLIATALPAAAGSVVNGTMVFKTGYTLARSGPGTDRHYLFSNFILTHTGGAPITGLTITIAVDTGNATLVRPPTITGGDWILVSGTSATSF